MLITISESEKILDELNGEPIFWDRTIFDKIMEETNRESIYKQAMSEKSAENCNVY